MTGITAGGDRAQACGAADASTVPVALAMTSTTMTMTDNHLPRFIKAHVGLASLLLIAQPLCAFLALQSQGNPSGQAGAAPVSEPKFRILRSISVSRRSSQES